MTEATGSRLSPHLPRPSHVLLHSRIATSLAIVAAVVLGLLAGLAPAWLLEVDAPLSEATRALDSSIWRWVTGFGGTQLGLGVSLLSALLLWNRCRALALTFPSMILLTSLVDVILKLLVDRERPVEPLVNTTLGSFPSGHTMQAVVIFGMLPPVIWVLTENRKAFWGAVGLFSVATPAIAFSRIALGAHWPSDVLASLMIGAALLLVGEYFVGSGWASVHCTSCALHDPGSEPSRYQPDSSLGTAPGSGPDRGEGE